MVHADAACVFITAIADGGRCHAQFLHPAGNEIVKSAGGDTRLDQRPDLVQDLRRHGPGLVHPGEILARVDADAFLGDVALIHG